MTPKGEVAFHYDEETTNEMKRLAKDRLRLSTDPDGPNGLDGSNTDGFEVHSGLIDEDVLLNDVSGSRPDLTSLNFPSAPTRSSYDSTVAYGANSAYQTAQASEGKRH